MMKGKSIKFSGVIRKLKPTVVFKNNHSTTNQSVGFSLHKIQALQNFLHQIFPLTCL